jgi:BlaI family penicillinase repressor
MNDTQLGDRELEVMNVLWDRGSGTVADVREQLPADLAYTTVLTILRNLEEKGLVTHEMEGRAHRYFPAVARVSAQSSALSRLMGSMFKGSAEELLVHLVKERQLSAAQLERVQRLIEEPDDAREGGAA